jgi:hypothetical protein
VDEFARNGLNPKLYGHKNTEKTIKTRKICNKLPWHSRGQRFDPASPPKSFKIFGFWSFFFVLEQKSCVVSIAG